MVAQRFEWPDLLVVAFDRPEEQADAEALLVTLGGVVQHVLMPVEGKCLCRHSPGFVLFRKEITSCTQN